MSADAIANGVALRTSGLLAQWQARLRHYPDELANAGIEDAALTWGGFTPAGLLTLVRSVCVWRGVEQGQLGSIGRLKNG